MTEIQDKEPKCIRKKKCIEEIRTIMTELGPWSVNISKLSDKYDFEWHTVDRWFTRIIENLPKENSEKVRNMGFGAINKAMAFFEKVMVDPNASIRDKVAIINCMNNTLNSFTEIFHISFDELRMHGDLDAYKIMQIAEESRLREEKLINAQTKRKEVD
jgi:hypothetical protein